MMLEIFAKRYLLVILLGIFALWISSSDHSSLVRQRATPMR